MWEEGKDYKREYDERYSQEIDFSLKLAHYRQGNENTNDTRRIKPRTADLYDVIRHKRAQILKDELYVEVWPIAPPGTDDDASLAEGSRFALEHVLRHQRYGYERPRERMVGAALAASIGAVTAEYDDQLGPYGEIKFRVVDPRRAFWTPGTQGPHDPECWWLIEERPVFVRDLEAKKGQKGWKNIDRVTAHLARDVSGTTSPDPSLPDGSVRFATEGVAAPGQMSETKTVTLLYCWKMEPKTTVEEVGSGYQELPPEQRYVFCPACGYEERYEDGSALPESPGLCPECGGTLERADAVKAEKVKRSYPEIKLTVIAVDGEIELYSEPWMKCRGFPYMVWGPYEHPYEPVGISDTTLHHSLQLIMDATLRLGYEQMSESRRIIITSIDGLQDANGNPWLFSDQGGVAYAADLTALSSTREFQPTSLPSGFTEFMGAIKSAFVPNRGTSDIYQSPENTKNIPVGTVEALQATGEIPVDDHKRTLHQREGIFFGVVLDMIAATWPLERWVRLRNEDGILHYKLIEASGLIASDVYVTASPKMKRVELEQAQALVQAAQLFAQSPTLGAFVLEGLNVPPSRVQRLRAGMDQEMAARQPAQPPNGGTGGTAQSAELGPPQLNGAAPNPEQDAGLQPAL